MKNKEQMLAAYEPPKIEVIEVQVEQGFAASGDPSDFGYGGGLNSLKK